MTRSERGAALLEAIVALAVFSVVASAAVTLASVSARAVQTVRRENEAVVAASAFLDAVTLWTRADLDRRLGDRRQGGWVMRVDRPRPSLYTVALTDSATRRLLIRTALYRPDTTDGTR